MLSVLAPRHTGWTVQEQPVLYWYLTKAISTPIEFTITDDGISPLIETALQPPFQPGVQRIRLADYHMRLGVGKAYQWFVSLVVNPKRRSKDILAGGMIERVELVEEVASKLAEAPRTSAPYLYAEAGLWYDAVAAISELIAEAPGDRNLLMQRAALLKQVGLLGIAQHDLQLKTAN